MSWPLGETDGVERRSVCPGDRPSIEFNVTLPDPTPVSVVTPSAGLRVRLVRVIAPLSFCRILEFTPPMTRGPAEVLRLRLLSGPWSNSRTFSVIEPGRFSTELREPPRIVAN